MTTFKLKIKVAICGLVLFSQAIESSAATTIVADLASDYTSKFQFYWNAPTGWAAGNTTGTQTTGDITNVSSYLSLIQVSGFQYTADGNNTGSDNPPASYLSISKSSSTSISGHPGRGSSQQGVGTFDRAVIVSYTVATAGYYFIEQSILSATNTDVNNNGNGVRALIFYQDVSAGLVTLINTVDVGIKSSENFNTSLSWLDVSDRIFVAYSANGSDSYDGFSSNYKIGFDTVPEPGRLMLLGLALGSMTMRRRRSHV